MNQRRAASGQLATQEEAKRKGRDTSRTPVSSTSLGGHDEGCCLVGAPQTRRRYRRQAESPAPHVARAHDRVPRVRSLRHQSRRGGSDEQLCKEGGATISSHTYMAEWPSLECVYAKITFFPIIPFGILLNHVYMVSHHSTFCEVKTNTLISTVFRPQN